MKKFFLVLVFSLLAIAGVRASVPAPHDDRGESLHTIDFVGADTCVVDASFTTVPIVCSSSSVIIYGVTANNAGFGDYMTFRSTNLAAATIVATTTVVFASSVTWNGTGPSAGLSSTYSMKFPVPFKMTNGMSVKLNATVASPGNWTIFYRKVRAGE